MHWDRLEQINMDSGMRISNNRGFYAQSTPYLFHCDTGRCFHSIDCSSALQAEATVYITTTATKIQLQPVSNDNLTDLLYTHA